MYSTAKDHWIRTYPLWYCSRYCWWLCVWEGDRLVGDSTQGQAAGQAMRLQLLVVVYMGWTVGPAGPPYRIWVWVWSHGRQLASRPNFMRSPRAKTAVCHSLFKCVILNRGVPPGQAHKPRGAAEKWRGPVRWHSTAALGFEMICVYSNVFTLKVWVQYNAETEKSD